MNELLREALAEYAHSAWAGWMEYMLPKLENSTDPVERDYWIARWARQMKTPYASLTEKEKESDRAEADKMLAILRGRIG
jgi:hypothetical protein